VALLAIYLPPPTQLDGSLQMLRERSVLPVADPTGEAARTKPYREVGVPEITVICFRHCRRRMAVAAHLGIGSLPLCRQRASGAESGSSGNC
jgi:hypothetical protein